MLYRTVFALWLKFYSTDLDRENFQGKISKQGKDIKNRGRCQKPLLLSSGF
jgi:hypothetical protein